MTKFSKAFGLAIAVATIALENRVIAAAPAKTLTAEDKEYAWYTNIESEAKAGRAGPEVPGLIAGLDGPDLKKRVIYAQLLYVVGPNAASAVPSLIRHVDDSDFWLRLRSIEALGGIGPDASAAVPALTLAVNDPDYPIANMAAWSLGQIGPAAVDAVPNLQASILHRPKNSDYYAMVVATSRVALAKITGKKGIQIVGLVALLREKDDPENTSYPALEATRALQELMPESKLAGPHLCRLLLDRRANPDERAEAANTLGHFNDLLAEPALVEAAQAGSDLVVRGAAIGALKSIKGVTANIAKLQAKLDVDWLKAQKSKTWYSWCASIFESK